MKKRVKVCTIEVYSEKTRLVSNISEKKSAEETFGGNKNRVLHDVKNFLKDASFYGSALSELMNAINRSSEGYIDKDVYSASSIIKVFNPDTGLLYEFDISYNIEDISRLPYRYSMNRKGENRYEKRLIQQYGGGRVGRYKLALSKVSTDKLIDLLSPVIVEEFKSKMNIDVVRTSGLSITFPWKIVLTPAENLVIKLSLDQRTKDSFRRYVYITYNGETVDFSLKEEDEITEESIERVLRLADKFDEICEIVKKAYNL
jgi:hypothetical protein